VTESRISLFPENPCTLRVGFRQDPCLGFRPDPFVGFPAGSRFLVAGSVFVTVSVESSPVVRICGFSGRISLSRGRISLSLSPDHSFFVAVFVESSPVVRIRGLLAGYRLRGGSVTNEYNGVKRYFAASFFYCFKTATFILVKGWINPNPLSNYSTYAIL
jgi:hypothetical protein